MIHGRASPYAHQFAQLVVVDFRLQRRDESGGDSQLAQNLNRFQLFCDERLAAELERRRIAKAVELQIRLQPVTPVSETAGKTAIAGQAETVRIDHHHVNRLMAGVFEDFVEGRVQRRLAAGKLQHLGPTFDFHQPVDGPLDLFERKMTPPRSARRVAHGAVQIAARRDFDQADARVLLVLGAQAAIERTASVWARAELLGHASGQTELELVVLRDVGANKILANAVRRALFAKIDPPLPIENLGRHERITLRTQTLGHSEEGIVAKCHARTPQQSPVTKIRESPRSPHSKSSRR